MTAFRIKQYAENGTIEDAIPTIPEIDPVKKSKDLPGTGSAYLNMSEFHCKEENILTTGNSTQR